MEYFEKLGDCVSERWKANNYDESIFDEVALGCLHDMPPAQHLSYLELIQWALKTERLPLQDLDSQFGQPPLTVYSSQRFYIEALFWLDATTDIHQHSFSGAFHVLCGASLQSRYEFKVRERINARLLLGELRFKEAEYLTSGTSRPIASGAQLIHSVFHLEEPSVTIVIRTPTDIEAKPQLSYLRPGIAYIPAYHDELLTRQLELLEVLHRTRHPDYLNLLAQLIANSDAESVFRILNEVYIKLDLAELRLLFEKTKSQHSSLLEALRPSLEEKRRQTTLLNRRGTVTDPDHRYFLALLLNLPNRASIFEFVRERYKTDPIDKVMSWIKELSGQSTPEKPKASPFGFSFNSESLSLFRCMLEGLSFPEALTKLREIHGSTAITKQEKELQALYSALSKSSLPLFIR